MKTKKIGIGLITCNRENFLKDAVESVVQCKDTVDEFVIVNDGTPLKNFSQPFGNWIQNENNLGVGKTKNKAFRHLLERNCDYIFLLEDDLLIKDKDVFLKYIDAHNATGIHHFNYGPGTPFNRKQSVQFDLHNRHELEQNTIPDPRLIIDYNNIKLSLFKHVAGVFSFFTKTVLDEVGLFNEEYHNAWEHVDHTYRIIKAGYHPPFWWFADLADSNTLLSTQASAIDNSSIAKNTQAWFDNLQKGRELYKRIHGIYPNHAPDTEQREVINFLKTIKTKNNK